MGKCSSKLEYELFGHTFMYDYKYPTNGYISKETNSTTYMNVRFKKNINFNNKLIIPSSITFFKLVDNIISSKVEGENGNIMSLWINGVVPYCSIVYTNNEIKSINCPRSIEEAIIIAKQNKCNEDEKYFVTEHPVLNKVNDFNNIVNNSRSNSTNSSGKTKHSSYCQCDKSRIQEPATLSNIKIVPLKPNDEYKTHKPRLSITWENKAKSILSPSHTSGKNLEQQSSRISVETPTTFGHQENLSHKNNTAKSGTEASRHKKFFAETTFLRNNLNIPSPNYHSEIIRTVTNSDIIRYPISPI